MSGSVSIKGTREGLTITLGAGDYEALYAELGEHLKTQGAFFRGGRVALQVGDRLIAGQQLQQLSELLSQFEMTLRTVMTTHAETQQAVNALGLRLVETTGAEPAAASAPPSAPPPAAPARDTAALAATAEAAEQPAPAAAPEPVRPIVSAPQPVVRAGASQEGSRGTLVRRLVRSGQVVRHPGHIVIIGDVNVGAEVIAGGDIVVWGRLYGTAHAGSMGDDNALVCALDFAPLQLRIGTYVARPGEDPQPERRAPEVAAVREGAIVVQPWDTMTRFGG